MWQSPLVSAKTLTIKRVAMSLKGCSTSLGSVCTQLLGPQALAQSLPKMCVTSMQLCVFVYECIFVCECVRVTIREWLSECVLLYVYIQVCANECVHVCVGNALSILGFTDKIKQTNIGLSVLSTTSGHTDLHCMHPKLYTQSHCPPREGYLTNSVPFTGHEHLTVWEKQGWVA